MSDKVVEMLNKARERELSAILQYMAQHYELEDKEFGKLADKIKAIGIQEMKHAEALAERILFLGGVPSSKPDTAAKKGQQITDMLKTDMGLEDQAMAMYNQAIQVCVAEKDNVSRELFERILKEEDDHFNYFDTTKQHVDELGASYLATLAS